MPDPSAHDPCITISDYRHPEGWSAANADARAHGYCAQLEAGHILCFDSTPFDLPQETREFLLAQKQTGSRLHKNISYKPATDTLSGVSSDGGAERERMHKIMRAFSAEVSRFLSQFLSPYAGRWKLDYASFRPLEEKGRDLPLHKRNDLMHVDAFPTRPTRGGRILRVFTNINPHEARIWRTGQPFHIMAPQYASQAGLARYAEQALTPLRSVSRTVRRAIGLADRSAYDEFMLHFHDWLKENSDFQQNGVAATEQFAPGCTWMVYTDGVPHAALSGQFALEHTYIIPREALVAPDKSPINVLEKLSGADLTR
jgi:3-deoxy-D-manno-octulosonic acid hydroxylase-like protein